MQFLAQFGGRTALQVLPLLAIVVYQAGPVAVGAVTALQYLPVVVVAGILGGLIDRADRRHSLIICFGLTSAALVLAPLADPHGNRVAVLLVLAATVGCTVAYTDLVSQTLVPDLVPEDQLVSANGRIELIYTLAQVSAPGLAGLLVDRITGVYSLSLAGAFTAAASIAATRIWLPRRGAPPTRGAGLLGGFRTATEGIRLLMADPVLRVISTQAALFNGAEQALLTLYTLHAVRVWGASAGEVGVTITVGGVGTLLAASLLGSGRVRPRAVTALVAGMGIASLPFLIVSLLPGPLRLPGMMAIFCVYGFGMTQFNIYAVTARQRRSPTVSMGRVMAAYRVLAFTPISLGALAGGVTADGIGTGAGLLVWALVLAVAWLVFSLRIRRLESELDVTFDSDDTRIQQRGK
jgi:predicted MFS family arabinose efflux permease